MPPFGTLAFGEQIAGTTSPVQSVTLPQRVAIQDLPQDAIVYSGGSTLLDAALAVAGVASPITVSILGSALKIRALDFTVDGASFSSGAQTEFNASVRRGDTIGTTILDVYFAPAELGARVEFATPLLSSTRVEGDGLSAELLTSLPAVISGFLANVFLRGTVSGTGTPPLTIEPAELDFGIQTVNSNSPAFSATITNRSPGSITIDGLSRVWLPGKFNLSFLAIEDSCTGQTLPSGGDCVVRWQFRPPGEGEFGEGWSPLGTFTDTSEAVPSTGVEQATLIGTGVRTRLTALENSIDFGSLPATTAGNEKMIFVNAQSPVTVSAIAFGGADPQSFALVDETVTGIQMSTGQEAAIVLGFSPTRIGHQTALCLIVGPDQRTLLEVLLWGLGTAAANLRICVGAAVSVTAGLATIAYEITVTNDGVSAAISTILWLQGPPGARFVSSSHPLSSPLVGRAGILSWRLGALPRAGIATVHATLSVSADLAAVPAKAWTSSATFDPDPATNAIDV